MPWHNVVYGKKNGEKGRKNGVCGVQAQQSAEWGGTGSGSGICVCVGKRLQCSKQKMCLVECVHLGDNACAGIERGGGGRWW